MVKSKIKLSIIILNYNSGHYLKKCLESIANSDIDPKLFEIIIVDNNSTDASLNLAQSFLKKTKKLTSDIFKLTSNLGFAAGNNRGIKKINPNSQYVLFLNPDTTVNPDTLKTMMDFFDHNSQVDAATCQINLATTGQMQPECHRGFPTPWRSFCYFTGISKLFPKSKFFNGYFLGHLNLTKIHPIEACVGAFLMVKKDVGQKINWWNEKYFFYGEDLDFCYQLHQHGYKLFFNPNCQITHFQGISSGIKNTTSKISLANRQTKITAAKASTEAMRTFYKENLFKNYSFLTRFLVLTGIQLLEWKRLVKAKYF